MKGYAGAGWINDHGVHRAAQFLDVGGAIDEVFAYTELFEPIRRDARGERRTTGEDAAVTVFRFASGALGHWMCATANHGEGAGSVWFYGSKGVLRPHQYAKFDDGSTILWEEIINRYAPNVIRGDFAHSYLELADAIEHGAPPISSADLATQALSVVFAALESATLGQAVKVAEVMAGHAHAYEDTVAQEMSALSEQI
jgi:predicted dehydrogenase